MPAAPIYTQYTPAHRILFEDHFQPTLPPGEVVHATFSDAPGDGEFQSAEWHRCVTRKFDILRTALAVPDQQFVIWCDADVQFFPAFSSEEMVASLIDSGKDVLFQQEGLEARPGHKEVNTGVSVARANSRYRAFVEQVYARMQTIDRPNDQNVINEILSSGADLDWGFLSPRYYARTHGFPPGRDIVLHHANTTTRDSVRTKCRQFIVIRDYVLGNTWRRAAAYQSVLLEKGIGSVARGLVRKAREIAWKSPGSRS